MFFTVNVFACPLKEDDLPKTIMEFLACGMGGIADMISDKENGYILPLYYAFVNPRITI